MLQHCKVVGNLCILTIDIERMLFGEVRILGDAAFTRKPNDHQHGEHGISRGHQSQSCDAGVSSPPYLKKVY